MAFGALAGAALTGAAPAGAVQAAAVRIASGVTYQQYDVQAAKGPTRLHVIRADLRDPRVRLDLLHPGAVAARAPVSQLADAQGAVAGSTATSSTSPRPSIPAWRRPGRAWDRRSRAGAP